MSTGHSEVTPAAQRASHVDIKFANTQALCLQALLDTPELHYLGHYTEGAYDFSYDRLNGISTPPDRTDCERIGVQVTNAVRGFDHMLQQVRTGALIRTVAHGQRGLVICNSTRPEQHVVAFSRAPTVLPAEEVALQQLPGARNTDQAVGMLVTRLRDLVDLSSQNPGSWVTAKPDEGTLPLVDAAAIGPHVEGAANHPLADRFRQLVDPSDLQLLAYCRDGQVDLLVDQLAHPQLGPYFQEISLDERRLFYDNLCRQFPMMVRKLARMTAAATGGKLKRVVLDVEQGAIYYYRIQPCEYLVGVTMIQKRVADADRKIAQMALECRDESLVAPAGP